MTTLALLRAKLNDQIGVITDAETSPWTTTQRNTAISDGYADLWRAGVWKDDSQDIATVDDTWVYALTSIRKLYRLEMLDSSGRLLELPKGIVEPDGAGTGTFQVRLQNPLAAGYTLRVRGWSPYISTFSDDTAVDDLPAEHNRIPLLKAQALLYRQQLAKFARYGEAQAFRPAMNVSSDVLMAIVATAEREYADACRVLSGQRPRVGISPRL